MYIHLITMDVTGTGREHAGSAAVAASSRRVTPSQRYKAELERLASFTGFVWPKPFIAINDLAKTGFFCLQDGDKVQCAFCHMIIGEFVPGDIPEDEHKLYNPACRFIRGLRVGNIPKVEIRRQEVKHEDSSELPEIRVCKNRIHTLESKVNLLQQEAKCKICLHEEKDTVLLPCCHMVSCSGCISQVEICPVCRVKIVGRVKVFT